MFKLIPNRLKSAFKYEALRAGSMREKTKYKYYDKLYLSLSRQAKTFEKSEFSDLEYQKTMVGELKPRSQLGEDELDAQLAMMYKMYDEQTLSVNRLKEERALFYEDYRDDLSKRIFYQEDGSIDPDAYNRFTNFVQIAHHSHIEQLYSSEIVADFMNQYGVESLQEFTDSDELYTEFFEYAEQEELRMRNDAGW